MSRSLHVVWATTLVACLSWTAALFAPVNRVSAEPAGARVPPAVLPAPPGATPSSGAKLDSFVAPTGESYFALSLKPTGPATAAAAHDLVVMFDTSASQTGEYREKALTALQSLLARLKPTDRVQLLAVDLNAIPLTKAFVPANSAEMQQALAQLRARVPLGSTDMGGALRTAIGCYAQGTTAGADRAIVYLGDGMSTGQLIASGDLKILTDALAAQHVQVTSYAIGPRLDNQLLGALACQTGGMLTVDNRAVAADQYGAYLAQTASAAVAWPTEVTLPESFRETYPKKTPPLRFDRDTVLIGVGKSDPASALTMKVQLGGQVQDYSWTVPASKPSDDYAFLPELVKAAQPDGGVSLPIVGSGALKEARLLVNTSADSLVKAGKQALATGNAEQAEKIALQALRLEPGNQEATRLHAAATKSRQAGAAAPAPRELKLARFQGGQTASGPDVDPSERDGRLLGEVENLNEVLRQKMEAEVKNAINQSRSRMGTDPEAAKNDLKEMMGRVQRTPELNADVRSQLINQLETALREASRQADVQERRVIEAQERQAQLQIQQELNRELISKQEKVNQLMIRFDSLMDERRYGDALNLAELARDVDRRSADLSTGPLAGQLVGNFESIMDVRNRKQRNFVEAMYAVETSQIPFPDSTPIVYPDAEVWRTLTERREKYKSVNLAQENAAEAKISRALNDTTEIDFVDTPLRDVVEQLKARHEIEIQLDNKALMEAGIGDDLPITKTLKGITLRSALRLMLRDHELTYVIRDEVLLITTVSNAETLLTTKVYPVADLVIPIQNGGLSGFGGLGGGLSGGMGGGGYGGGGGGMGGMGGGMGGGGLGGGGGGGFFAVKDDLKLSSKSKPATVAPTVAAPVVAPALAPVAGPHPADQPAPKTVEAVKPVQIEFREGQDPDAVWNAHFVAHKEDPAAVRESVRRLMKEKKYEHVIALINAALRNSQEQSWMYEALGLAMQADGRSPQDIERVLMSAVDFIASPGELLYLAHYMARNNLEKRALQLYRQVAQMQSNQPDPYVYGLALAKRLEDTDGIRWSSLGLLSQAWPKDETKVWQTAELAAKALIEKYKTEKRSEELKKFEADLKEALIRDFVVMVSWTGDADLDLLVEEPTGTVCSFRNPRTTAGGVMLGDMNGVGVRSSSQGSSEVYVCPKGFDGNYRFMVQRVWGKPTANQVTVEIFSCYGSIHDRRQKKQLPLVDDKAFGVFDLHNGRRHEPLAEAQVATAVANQVAVSRQILAQQLNAITDPSVAGGLLAARAAGGFPFFGRGAVGYQPVIITLPEGANMSAIAVVSADRRYVRITPQPLFSLITQVNTFNYASGSSGSSGGGSGGSGFGGAGGGGGGFGGGF